MPRPPGLANERAIRPACVPSGVGVRLRPLDREHVALTVVEAGHARVLTLSLKDEACAQVFEFSHPPLHDSDHDFLLQDGCIYRLTCEKPARYAVTDLERERTLALPVCPARYDQGATVADFWADADSVVYVNWEGVLAADSFVVCCDWQGAVRWKVGLASVFPDMFLYLWDATLSRQADGSFLVYYNGEGFPDANLVCGLLWVAQDGTVRDATRVSWRPEMMADDDVTEHLGTGTGVLVGTHPVLVVHSWSGRVFVRTHQGTRTVLRPEGSETPLQGIEGTATAGDHVVVGLGDASLMVFEAADTRGEPR